MLTPRLLDAIQQAGRVGLCHAAATRALHCACLLVLPAIARAHNGDAPLSPEASLWSALSFLFLLAFLSGHYRRALQRRGKPAPRPAGRRAARKIPDWVRRWLYWDIPRRPARNASRQARRAFERRRR